MLLYCKSSILLAADYPNIFAVMRLASCEAIETRLLLNGAKTLLCEIHAEMNHTDNFHNANAALTYLQIQTKQLLN